MPRLEKAFINAHGEEDTDSSRVLVLESLQLELEVTAQLSVSGGLSDSDSIASTC